MSKYLSTSGLPDLRQQQAVRRLKPFEFLKKRETKMTVERDDYGDFHVRGTYDDGEQGWGIEVWLKGSDQDGPEDHRYRVVSGKFENNVDQAEKEAVLALIEKWEEKLPAMVASPINA